MSLQFKVISKVPKDKYEIKRDGRIIGYIDYAIENQEYRFKAEFEIKLSADQLIQIADKMAEITK